MVRKSKPRAAEKERVVLRLAASQARNERPRTVAVSDYTPPEGMEHYLELAAILLRKKKAA